jgi:hypothetical protein
LDDRHRLDDVERQAYRLGAGLRLVGIHRAAGAAGDKDLLRQRGCRHGPSSSTERQQQDRALHRRLSGACRAVPASAASSARATRGE